VYPLSIGCPQPTPRDTKFPKSRLAPLPGSAAVLNAANIMPLNHSAADLFAATILLPIYSAADLNAARLSQQ
jgi:hypothetical protein